MEWSPAGQLPGTGISLAKNVTIRWSARGLVLTVMLALLLSTCLLSYYCNSLGNCRAALLVTLAEQHATALLLAQCCTSLAAAAKMHPYSAAQEVIGTYDTMSVPGSAVATHRVVCPIHSFHWVHRFHFAWVGSYTG